MAYPLSAPVDFSAEGNVSLTLTNNLSPGNVIWNISTNGSDGINIGTNQPSSTSVLLLNRDSGPDPNGSIEVSKMKLVRGVNKVSLDTDPSLSTSYSFVFPATTPTGNQSIVSNGSSNVFYDIHAKNNIIVRKNPGPGEFSSIVAAIAAIPVFPTTGYPSINNKWVIYINPGTYLEASVMIIPSFVYIVGESMESVTVAPSGIGYSTFQMLNNSGIAFLGVENSDPSLPAINCDNCGNFIILHKVTATNCQKFLSCTTNGSATDHSYVFLEYIDTTNSTDYTLRCVDTNTLGGFGTIMSIENFFTFEHNNDSIIVNGKNTHLLSHASEMESDGSGNCIHVSNGGLCNIRGMAIKNYTNGILVDNDVSIPNIVTTGVTYQDCTININMLNASTIGNATGYTEYLKTIVPKTAPFFITNKDQNIITVAKKGADFTSVVAAMAAIIDNSVTNRYTVYVGPGVFVETQIVMKDYVSIIGFFPTQTILVSHPSVVGTPFIIGAGYAALDKLTITTSSYGTPPSYLIEYNGHPSGIHFRCDNIILDSSAALVHIGTANGNVLFLFLNNLINRSAPFTKGLVIEDSASTLNSIRFAVNNFIWAADATGVSNATNIFEITSGKIGTQNIFGFVTNTSLGANFFGPGNAIGYNITGSVYLVIDACLIGGILTGVNVQSSAETTLLVVTATTFTLNTNDIIIQSSTAQGSINVNATLSKININTSANFGVQIGDTAGSIATGGQIYQGPTWSQITNVSEQIQEGASIGVINAQPVISSVGGLNVSISGGNGYIHSTTLKYVTWSANSSFALPNNSLSWLYVDQNGTILSQSSQPDPTSTMIIGAVKTYGGSVTYIQEIAYILDHAGTYATNALKTILGPIVKSGCIASPGSSLIQRAVQVSSGTYYLSSTAYPTIGGDNVSMIGYYGGTNETAPFTNVPLQWDNAGVLTGITIGLWVKHALYILTSLSGSTQYFLVYGQQQFASELTAQTGPLPAAPPSFVANICPVTGIIVTDSDPSSPLSSTRFRDIRPTLSFRSEGATASADHNSLLNLTIGNAHPQYFRVDGTSTMSGNIQLSGNDIVGSGGNLLNGVDITAHASRHLPGGADALTTAVPVSIGSANSIGVAASFSRSDHVHAGVASLTGTVNQISTSASVGSVTLSTPSDFVAPGTIQDTTGLYLSSTSGILASGATQGTATALSTSYNEVSTTPVGTGVLLQTPTKAGLKVEVVNRGANALNVYPNVGGQIDGIGLNSPAIIPSGTTATYEASSTTQWYTVVPAVAAGLGTTITYINGQAVIDASAVSTFSAGTTGFAPSVPTGGNVVLSGILGTSNGGTGLNSSTATNGQLLIGTGTGLALSTITPGSGVNITNGSGTINIANSGVTSFSAGTTGLSPPVPTTGPVVLSGTLGAGNGGTDNSTYTIGDILYASGSTSISKLSDVATGNALISGGVSAAPTWGKIGLATHVSGTLPATSGGTNQTTYTTGDLLYASSATALSKLSDVATGNVLTSGGINTAPLWDKVGLGTHVSGVLPIANGGTNSSTSLNNNRIMVSSSSAIVESAVLTNGQLLIGSTGNPPVVGNITPGTGINITNGTGTITTSLTNTAVTPGSYTLTNLTVDAQGRITAASNGTAGTVTNVGTTAGELTGGPITTTGTLGLANTTVAAGSYTNTNITVDAKGRITSAANGAAAGTGYLGSQNTSSPINGTVHNYIVPSGKLLSLTFQVFAAKSGGGTFTGNIAWSVSGATTTWGTITNLCQQIHSMASGDTWRYAGNAIVTTTTTNLGITLVNSGSGGGVQTLSNYGTIVNQLN